MIYKKLQFTKQPDYDGECKTAVLCPKCGTSTNIESWTHGLPALCPECNNEIELSSEPINLGFLGGGL